MDIFHDGFIYDFQQVGGINRYHNEIIRRLAPEDTPMVSSYLGRREFWPENARLKVIRSRPFASAPLLAGLGRTWMSVRTALLRADIVHPTYYQRLTPGPIRRLGKPLVITVHDMIHELFPDALDKDGSVRRAKKESIEAADAILCNSQNTRIDLLRYYPSVNKRVVVTPLASSLTLGSPSAKQDPAGKSRGEQVGNGEKAPYFLFVGGREAYKNFATLLKAWALHTHRSPAARLRVVGKAWTEEEDRLIETLRIRDSLQLCGKVSDETLASLYKGSMGLIYPSCYEGFGIPVLEAMRCEAPVICSNTSSLPEVGGDAAVYFAPQNSEELAERIGEIEGSTSLRAQCIEKGLKQAALFSWDKTAEMTRKVYAQLAR